jgi:putative ABC transport system permease protein
MRSIGRYAMPKSLRRKIIKDMKANWGQFLAVWLVVTLGTAFYGAMYPGAENLLASLYRTYDDLSYLDFQVQAEAIDPGVLNTVRAIPGVESAEARLIIDSELQIDPAQSYLITLRLVSVPDDRPSDVNRYEVVKGHTLQEPGELLALESFAKRHDLHPGDIMRVALGGKLHELRIGGLVFNPEYLVAGRSPESPFPTLSTFGVAWMRYSELAALAEQPDVYNDLVVHLEGKTEDDRDTLQQSVRTALDGIFANSNAAIFSRIQTASGGVVDANVNGNFPIMIFFSGLFLAGATIVTGILMARLVESERQRIGTLRAMGITRRELLLHYLAFGFITGVTGGIVGSVLGYLNSFVFMYTFLDYFAGGTLPGFTNTPQIPFILLGFGIVVLGSTLSGAYSAWVQSGTPPGIALRPATPKTPNALSRAGLRFLPLVVRQTIRNLLRAPGRSLSTALGVMAGSMMLFSALALWDTMDYNFGTYYIANAYELRVDMNAMQPADSLEMQISQIEHVDAVQATLGGTVSVMNTEGDSLDTIAIAVDESDPFINLTTLEGQTAFADSDGVWIGHNVERVLGVSVGDTLHIHALNQTHEVTVRGIVTVVLGSPIYIPRTLLSEWTPGHVFPANMALVRVPPQQIRTVRDAIAELPGVTAVEVIDDFHGDIDHYIEYYRINTLVFGGFGLILTIALLFNSVNASLRERREELAVLLALGTTRREIALTVTLELLIMVVLGALIGVPIGRGAGFWMNHAYDTDFYGMVSQLRLGWYVIGIGGLLVAVLVAEIPGLRGVYKSDLGQVSKSQSF